jgi:hypothetical protein
MPAKSWKGQGWHAAIATEAIGGRAVDEAKDLQEGGAYLRALLARASGELGLARAIFQNSGAVYRAAQTALQMRGSIRQDALATYKRLGLSEVLRASEEGVASAVGSSAK